MEQRLHLQHIQRLKETEIILLNPKDNTFGRYMGPDGRHMKLFGENSNALGFNMSSKYKEMGEPQIISIVGTLSNNYFMGEITPQIEIIEFKAKAVNEKALVSSVNDLLKNL